LTVSVVTFTLHALTGHVAADSYVSGRAAAGDVDDNDVVTCRDVVVARDSEGTRTTDSSRRADMNADGWIDRDDTQAMFRLLPKGSVCRGVPKYLIVLGHDGSPDPDDNLAQLAGFMAVKRASQRDPRVAFGGLVFGDSTSARKAGMASGSAKTSRANWEFHRSFNVPAMMELGLTPSTHADVVEQPWNFDATDPSQITGGGRLLFSHIKAAIDAGNMERVVYTAGGGQHVAAEAIGLLRNRGYTHSEIRNHFAVVQHSRMNWTTYTEPGPARPLTLDYTIRIDDQNGDPARGSSYRPRSGVGFPPERVSSRATSPEFAEAWFAAAVGGSEASGIPHHRARKDASDSGEAAFASTPALMDRYWRTRGIGLSLAPHQSSACDSRATQHECIVYAGYSTPEMHANMK
jgi:hypothetical protein